MSIVIDTARPKFGKNGKVSEVTSRSGFQLTVRAINIKGNITIRWRTRAIWLYQ